MVCCFCFGLGQSNRVFNLINVTIKKAYPNLLGTKGYVVVVVVVM
jgi:hypothetical protein